MTSSLHVLIVDDHSQDREWVAAMLQRDYPDLRTTDVGDALSFSRALETGGFDLVVTDYHLPQFDGLTVLREVRARWPELPVIMFTDTGSEEIAVQAMKEGLDDYVLKSPTHSFRLSAVVRSVLRHAENRRALQQSEEQAREIQRRLAAIVGGSDDAVIGKTLDGVVQDWNAGAERIYGYTAAEIVGKNVALLVPPERQEELREILDRLRRGEAVRQLETVRVRRDGRRIHVSMTDSPIRDASGRVIGAATIARDISESKRAQEELALYHDLVTHDVSNFGMAMLAIVERLLLQADGPLTAKQTELLRRARRQSMEVGRLSDNARTLVRLRLQGAVPEAPPVNVVEALRSAGVTVHSIHFDRRFEMQIDGPEDLQVPGVPFLGNVFLNLLDNAVRYSPEGAFSVIRIRADRDGNFVRIAVRNPTNSEGEVGPHLFERYARGRRFKGAGLGLSVVKQIVERANGRIEARDLRDGAAYEFEIEIFLPAVPRGEGPEPRAAS